MAVLFVFIIDIQGPDAVGKTRLVEECIAVTPKCIQVYRIHLTQAGKVTYSLLNFSFVFYKVTKLCIIELFSRPMGCFARL